MLEGTCRFSSVHTQTFKKGGRHTRDPDQRTLMFFKGDTHNYHMQATILVRSDRAEDLKRVKRVLQVRVCSAKIGCRDAVAFNSLLFSP